MSMYGHLFERQSRHINLCFLFNSIGSTLLMPLALLYLAGTSLSAKEILYLGTMKFWSFSLSYFLVIPLVSRFDVKKMIVFSLFFKLLSLAVLFTGQTFMVCMIVMLTNGLASSFFSTASKIYVRATSKNISESFSARMTLSNAGAAISPMVISALVFFAVPFHPALLILIALFTVGVLVATGLKPCQRVPTPEVSATGLTGLFSKETATVATLSIVFAMLYYTFETIVPLELVQRDLKSLIGPVMLFNTGVIILGQIPVYKYFTEKFGVVNALLIATALCIVLFIPWFLQWAKLSGLLLIVVGVTFLEMFYGAGIDTVIASADSDKKIALLDGVSSVALSAGAALAAAIYGDPVMFIPFVMTLFVLSFFFVRGEKTGLIRP
ncbi:MFS transporter [Enterobacter cloacae]|nr:MFS transporter [Enterobacter cloacae]